MNLLKFRALPHALLIAGSLLLASGGVSAHGDMAPQAVDTSSLPQLGKQWLAANPYNESSPARSEAVRIGASGYNQNCARCHGLEAISGGIAPDLRQFEGDCTGMKDPRQKDACFKEMDDYFMATVRRGRVRGGRVYMPPFEDTLTQEAIWAIRAYVETRREP